MATLKFAFSVKSATVIAFMREHGVQYPAVCNAVNSRIDKVEFSTKDAAKLGTVRETKDGTKWGANQAFQAVEIGEHGDIIVKFIEFDKAAASMEKRFSTVVEQTIKPTSDVAKWLLKFAVAKATA